MRNNPSPVFPDESGFEEMLSDPEAVCLAAEEAGE